MEDARLHAELRRYWDELARGELGNPGDIDPDLVQTIQRLHALGDVPPPAPAYATRLRESLMHATALPLPLGDPRARSSLNGRSTPVARRAIRPWPVPQRPWALSQLATAALLVLVLVSSFLAFGPGRPGLQDEGPALIPAINGTPATAEMVATETLLETEVAALPAGRIRVSVDRWRLKPSPAAVTLPPYEATQLFTVDAGEVTVNAAGAEHRLGSGDVLDLTDQEFSFGASGSAEAVAYVVYVSSKFSAEFGHGATRTWLSGDPLVHATDVVLSSSADDFAGGPVRLVLERMTVPPGTALPPQEARPLVWTEVGQGTLGLTLEGERVPYGWTSGVEQKVRFGEYAVPQELTPGITVQTRNAGDDPLILYRLTLIPSEAGSPGAAHEETTATPPG